MQHRVYSDNGVSVSRRCGARARVCVWDGVALEMWFAGDCVHINTPTRDFKRKNRVFVRTTGNTLQPHDRCGGVGGVVCRRVSREYSIRCRLQRID